MFDTVVVGVEAYERGRHALELAKALVSADGRIVLVYVEVLQSASATESTTSNSESQRYGLTA